MIHVIIPVYKGLDETKRCIESVLGANNLQDHHITVIDDCGPDSELKNYLIALSQNQKFQLIRNEQNLGFVASVNLGMALDSDADVILLNSDTEVAGDWLDRLYRCAYSSSNIGTVTPFSNNATICSYPKFCDDNALPEGWDVAKLDAIFRQANTGKSIEIPTAVGFCMYIKRSCLNVVGLFDVGAFGKGYGEENDFCMRAHKHGWRHVLCADTFVYHAGGVSFAETQNARKVYAMSVLQKRYPLYKILIARHLKKDPAKPYRLAIDFLRILEPHRPVTLFITHRRGGGTERHIHELSRHFENDAQVLVLRPYLWDVVVLEWVRSGERFRLYFNIKRDYAALLTFLRLVGVGQIHFHHLFGHSPQIWKIPSDINVAFDFTVHDYYSICPRISLTSTDHRYCGEPNAEQCNTCLQRNPQVGSTNIQKWRDENRAILNKAMRVFVPSQDGVRRIKSYFNDANVVLAPHLDIATKTKHPEPKALPLSQNEKMRIVVIGAMSQIKGADILEQCVILANRFNLPLKFHLIGYAYKDLAILPELFSIHGEYEDIDLPRLILDSRPHVIWFSAQCPETYSYTLSAALMSGFPIVATNIGAFSERLNKRSWSWICPWDWTSDEWNNFFVQIRKNHFTVGVGTPQKNDLQSPPYYMYQDYLQASKPASLTSSELEKVRHLLSSHDRAHFNFFERTILNSRKIISPLLHLSKFSTPIIQRFGKILSPYNRKMIKSWLSGRWPS